MLAGAVSRGVAGVATAPLELARTRMQAAQRSGVPGTRFWQHLVPPPGATPLQRFTFLWTGDYRVVHATHCVFLCCVISRVPGFEWCNANATGLQALPHWV
jgi:hypothetical protein